MPTHTMHDEGNSAALAALVEGGTLKIGLFVNDVTPVSANGLSILVEPTWLDYDQKVLDETNGTAAGIVGGVSRWVFLDLTWELTEDLGSPVSVYGWFVVIEPAGGSPQLLFSSRFSSPKVVENTGDRVRFSLTTYQADLTSV